MKSNVLEKEVQRFFECGWLLQIISGQYYLRNPRSSNLIYSKEMMADDEFDTPFEYGSRDEKESALRILEFIENHPEIIPSYQRLYPGKIIYSN